MRQHTVQTPYMVGEVHFYSTRRGAALVMFDCGPPSPEGEDVLHREVDLERLEWVVVTHCHVDHYGLANHILKQSNARVLIPRSDAVKLKRHEERMARISEMLRGYGFGADFAASLRESFDRNKVYPAYPERFGIVEESRDLEELGIEFLSCPGHSQSDLVYLSGDWAVTGDVLLRNIFQAPLLDVDLATFAGRFRNYDAYCASLGKLAVLRGRRILPGHRRDVEGVDETILFYVMTMLDRSRQLILLRGMALHGIMEHIFKGRLRDPLQIYLKASEIVFMLDMLDNPSLLRESLTQIGLFDKVSGRYENVVSLDSGIERSA